MEDTHYFLEIGMFINLLNFLLSRASISYSLEMLCFYELNTIAELGV